MSVILCNKKRGETPKEALERLKSEHPRLRHETLSYAGRLDPLAEGLLLVLSGPDLASQDTYRTLPKEYLVEVLFGWSTDTYDVLGRLTDASQGRVEVSELMEALIAQEGVFEKPYPPYSSKPVFGEPLFWWAREDRLSEITLPTHKVAIHRIKLLKTGSLTGKGLYEHVRDVLALVKGDFRQDEIYSCWEKNLVGMYAKQYDTAMLEVQCSSGAYMRQLAHDIGQKLHIPALALQIVRTKIGNYELPLKD